MRSRTFVAGGGLLFITAIVAMAQPCPEPIPFVKTVPCTPGPGLYIQNSVREIPAVQRAYTENPVTMYDVEIDIQTGNSNTAQYAVSLTVEKSNSALATKHLIVERSVGMWTKVHFVFEDCKRAVSVSVQELAAPVDFNLSE